MDAQSAAILVLLLLVLLLSTMILWLLTERRAAFSSSSLTSSSSSLSSSAAVATFTLETLSGGVQHASYQELLHNVSELVGSSAAERMSLQKADPIAYVFNESRFEPLRGRARFGNVLLIKVPKAGGSTLAVTFQRFAFLFKLRVAVPKRSFSVSTCSGPLANRNDKWMKFVKQNHPPFDVFASHGCYIDKMQAVAYPDPWSAPPDKQLVVSIVREPWSRLVSEYRFMLKKCEVETGGFKSAFCGKTFDMFVQQECRTKTVCSFQYKYISGKTAARHHFYTNEEIAPLLQKYHLILAMERFAEGLVLLHLLYQLPWITIPYLVANENNNIPKPEYPADLPKFYLHRGLQADKVVYDLVNLRLDGLVKLAGKERVSRLVQLLTLTNIAIEDACLGRNGTLRTDDCIVDDIHARKEIGCYHACMERVTAGMYELNKDKFQQ